MPSTPTRCLPPPSTPRRPRGCSARRTVGSAKSTTSPQLAAPDGVCGRLRNRRRAFGVEPAKPRDCSIGAPPSVCRLADNRFLCAVYSPHQLVQPPYPSRPCSHRRAQLRVEHRASRWRLLASKARRARCLGLCIQPLGAITTRCLYRHSTLGFTLQLQVTINAKLTVMRAK